MQLSLENLILSICSTLTVFAVKSIFRQVDQPMLRMPAAIPLTV